MQDVFRTNSQADLERGFRGGLRPPPHPFRPRFFSFQIIKCTQTTKEIKEEKNSRSVSQVHQIRRYC